MEDKKKILYAYTRKLKKSGYSNQQSIDKVTSGAVGYQRRNKRLGKVHREGWETCEVREINKLVGKSTWFIGAKHLTPTQQQNHKETQNKSKNRNNKEDKKKMKETTYKKETPDSIISVKRTPRGEQATELKRVEQELNQH